MFTIKVGTMPGQVLEYSFESPTTVREMFREAKVTTSGKVLKLDGAVVELDTIVSNGNLLVATKQIKGN